MRKIILCIMFLGIQFTLLHSQVINSGKKSFYINNQPVEEKIIEKDLVAPEILVISPDLSLGDVVNSETAQFKIAGKVEDDRLTCSLFINSEQIVLSDQGYFIHEINLDEENTKISLMAFDSSNNFSIKEFTIYYQKEIPNEELEFYEKGTYYALLIGVEKYADPSINNLDNPVNDAKKLQEVLINNYRFDKENVILLKNPKRIDIIEELDRLSNIIEKEDNLLIFYAGHGYWDRSSNIGYWLPSDAKKDSKGAWFRNSTLCDYLKEIDSRHTLLVADACFAGGIFKTRDAFSDASKAVQLLYELPSRKAMTSGTLTEVPDQSMFVKFLVDRLEKNEEKYLSSEQLFSSFRIAVINNCDVVPQYGEIKSVGDEGGDFIFIRKELKTENSNRE